MSNKIRVALDVDGVLADLYPHICFLANRRVDSLDSWDVPWMKSYLNERMFCQDGSVSGFWSRDLWPNRESLNVIQKFDNIEIAAYITAIPGHLRSARAAWLERYKFPYAPTICNRNKNEEMKKQNIKWIVDDSPRVIEEVEKTDGLRAVQIVPSYFKRVEGVGNYVAINLCDALELIEEFDGFDSKSEN